MDGEDRKYWLQQEINQRGHPTLMTFKMKEQDTCGAYQLQHPFTCMVSGITGSGKTVWVKKLLENAEQAITPTPQRIVWCYSHTGSLHTLL